MFDTLLSYSLRWKNLQINSDGPVPLNTYEARHSALTAADVPNWNRSSLDFHDSLPMSSEFLTIPTLRHVTLRNVSRIFRVNWAVLASVTIRGGTSRREMGRILQQTKRLEFCDITVNYSNEFYPDEINLRFLKTLIVGEPEIRDANSSGAYSILQAITAPILEILDTNVRFFDLALSGFSSKDHHILVFFL